MQLKQLIIIHLAIALSVLAAARSDEEAAAAAGNSSAEQQELDDLIKTLEERMKANRASSAESTNDNNGLDEHERDLRGAEARPRIIDAPAFRVPIKRTDGQDDNSDESEEEREARDKRRTAEAFGQARELKKPTGKKIQRSPPSDFEKDEAYYKSLLRARSPHHDKPAYNKRYLDYETALAEARPSRHCGGDVSRKLGRIASRRATYLERSRTIADRIADAAVHMVRKKGRILRCLHSACGCGRNRYDEPEIIGSAKSVAVAAAEKSIRRDTEVAEASSASHSHSSTSSDVHVGSSNGKSHGLSVDVDSHKHSSAESSSSSSATSTDVHVGSSHGTSHGKSHGLGLGSRGSLLGVINSCDDYERKMIMDLAIDDAAGMIRDLAYQTRASLADRENPELERRIVGLAVDLVNQVTTGVTGDNLDVFGDLRYKNADDYLKSTLADAEYEGDYLSNAGFDYITSNRPFYDGLHAIDDEPYVGEPRCDSCAKYDITLGNRCAVCKRSSPTELPKLQSRIRRNNGPGIDKGKIFHLEQMPQVQRKSYKSGGVWEDVNKLYNFDDYENDKFIDLSLNCTRDPENLNCQRLNFHLTVPKGADPVPLWFVRDNLSQGRALAADMHERAAALQRPKEHSASMLHYLGNRVPMIVRQFNKESQALLLATKVLAARLATEYNLKPGDFLEFVQHHGFRVTGSSTCRPRQRICNSLAKFRSLDGSCNNFAQPSWGRANTALLRILPARYSDDIYALPVSASGQQQPLPNARQVSSRLFARRTDAFESQLALAFAQWGQILAHDMARQVADQTADGGIECCNEAEGEPLAFSKRHHSCAPIVHAGKCANFVRSMTIAGEDCSIGAANQLNAASSFLDLSQLYGADEAASARLRLYRGGLLRYEVRASRLMPPTCSVRSGSCDGDKDVCYRTGDTRGNQDPQLAVMLTLLIREHTRLAYELAAINPHWDDERLFQECRRIVIAEYQHITYRYWLPLVIGKKYCKDHKICPDGEDLSHAYSEKVNPSTINGFTTGAFRFLHSLVEGNISLVTENNNISRTLRLSDYYFRPGVVEADFNFESLLRGLVRQPVQRADSNFHPEISEYLFRSAGEFGMDLQALDVQRSRDHGLPGYNAYRRICGLEAVEDFHGLINEISLNNIEKLRSVYAHVDDIDLLVGVTMENRMPGSLVGPTARCLIGEQFYRSRVGDKYFYNNANFQHSFTPGQFDEIKKGSLAVMICDLGGALSEIQKNPFKVPGDKSSVPCSNLSRINLQLWREEIEA